MLRRHYCGSAWWPAQCGDCDGGALKWIEAPLAGRVWRYAVYHRFFDQHTFEVPVQYVVAAVEHKAGVCLPGRIAGPVEGLTVGSAVTASFGEIEGTTTPLGAVTELQKSEPWGLDASGTPSVGTTNRTRPSSRTRTLGDHALG